MEGGSLNKELHRAGLDITASAFVQRRKQIPSELLGAVLTMFNEQNTTEKLFNGYRILAVDGTAVNMRRNPASPCFVSNESAPDGYCQMHVTPLYDVLAKSYYTYTWQPQPKQDEIGALYGLLSWYDFNVKTLVVGDRNFSSYNLYATIQDTPNADFLIRVKQGRGAMREVAKLPMTELDREISFTITTTQTQEDKENGYILVQTRKNEGREYSEKTRAGRWDFPSPYPMKLRIVRIRLNTGKYETLATSLPPSFTAEQIKELYHARWGIETAFRELKYHLGLVNLHGRSDEFVAQEIAAAMIMANFCSRIVNKVVIRQPHHSEYSYAVNLKMAVYLCKKFLRTPGADGDKLMDDISKYTEPIRPGREDARN